MVAVSQLPTDDVTSLDCKGFYLSETGTPTLPETSSIHQLMTVKILLTTVRGIPCQTLVALLQLI